MSLVPLRAGRTIRRPYPTALAAAYTAALIVAPLAVSACGSPEAPPHVASPLTVTNGFSVNGFSVNGFSVNGFSVNGFSVNGFSVNSLVDNGFSVNGFSVNGTSIDGAFPSWFESSEGGEPALKEMVVQYVVRCALSAGRSASYTDAGGTVHTWPGLLGLADSWDTQPLTTEQKQWISACLAAHVNSAQPEPRSIQISLRGAAPSLASSVVEKQLLSTFDGVFFGDVFSSPPRLYVCAPNPSIPSYAETIMRDWGRECYLSSDRCGVFTRLDCATACQPTSGEYPWGPTCTADGVTYPAINAYVPRFKRAVDWIRSGVALVSCTGCLDGRALTGFGEKASATVGGWTGIVAADIWLDIRYRANATNYLRIQVNSVPVMNGTSERWEFPSTGSSSTWRTLSVPAHLPAGGQVKLLGARGVTSPAVDVVSVRVRQ